MELRANQLFRYPACEEADDFSVEKLEKYFPDAKIKRGEKHERG